MTTATTTRRRRALGWAAVAAAFILLAIVAAVVSDAGSWSERRALDPESAGPDGARAVARVLAAQGVDVRVERSADAARAALGPGTTLVLPDAAVLTDDRIDELAEAAGTVVLVEPRAATLDALLPGSASAGFAGADPIEPGCPGFERAGEIVAGETYTPGPGVTGCYPADGGYALLGDRAGDRSVWAVDGRALFANDAVAEAGNAALALRLLGEHPTVVWYAPSLADAAGEGAPTLGELTPRWVSPVMATLIVAAVVAAIWRGRRFGPLVAENLPVTVRGSETTVGRGRLYAHARDAGHALEQLRRATRRRIAGVLGLSAHAGPEEVADAVAARLDIDRAPVRDVLVDAQPADDRALVDLDARLRELEARVRQSTLAFADPASDPPRTVLPEGNTP